ncbi:MAG: hypothetical protein V8R79_05020 [Candidatus Gastranaerophilaceae bacterium]
MENFENKEDVLSPDDFLSILKELEYMEKKEAYASSIASVGHDSLAVVASSRCSSLIGVSITSASPSSLKLNTSSQMLTHCPHPIHLS